MLDQNMLDDYDTTETLHATETLDKLRLFVQLPAEIRDELTELHRKALDAVKQGGALDKVAYRRLLKLDLPGLLNQLNAMAMELSETMAYLMIFPEDIEDQLEECSNDR